jgi:hypothetical protein
MSYIIKLFDAEYPIDGNYLQYVDKYPSLQLIKNVPDFLEKASNSRNHHSIANFVIGAFHDNKDAISNISSLTKNMNYTHTLNNDAIGLLLYSDKNADVSDFMLREPDYDLLKSMNGTLENHLIEGMNNSNNLYEKIIDDYIKNEKFPAHFHNISYLLKRPKDLTSNSHDPVWKMLIHELLADSFRR